MVCLFNQYLVSQAAMSQTSYIKWRVKCQIWVVLLATLGWLLVSQSRLTQTRFMVIAYCQRQESIPTVGFHRTNWDNGVSIAEAYTYIRIYENSRRFDFSSMCITLPFTVQLRASTWRPWLVNNRQIWEPATTVLNVPPRAVTNGAKMMGLRWVIILCNQ